MTDLEVIKTVRTMFMQGRWERGTYHVHDRYCLAGAINVLTSGDPANANVQSMRVYNMLGFRDEMDAIRFNDQHGFVSVVELLNRKLEFDTILVRRAKKYPPRITVKVNELAVDRRYQRDYGKEKELMPMAVA